MAPKGRKKAERPVKEITETDEEEEARLVSYTEASESVQPTHTDLSASGPAAQQDEAARWQEAKKKANEGLKALREQREKGQAAEGRRPSTLQPPVPGWRKETHQKWKEEDKEVATWKKAREDAKANLQKLREQRRDSAASKGPSSSKSGSAASLQKAPARATDAGRRPSVVAPKVPQKLKEERRASARSAASLVVSSTKVPQWRKEVHEKLKAEDAEVEKWREAKKAAKANLEKLKEERRASARSSTSSTASAKVPQWRKEAQEKWKKEDAAAEKWIESKKKANLALKSQKEAQKKSESSASLSTATGARAKETTGGDKGAQGKRLTTVTRVSAAKPTSSRSSVYSDIEKKAEKEEASDKKAATAREKANIDFERMKQKKSAKPSPKVTMAKDTKKETATSAKAKAGKGVKRGGGKGEIKKTESPAESARKKRSQSHPLATTRVTRRSSVDIRRESSPL